jgi:aspartyl-tRNA(Asn)/glutamyl-tRNA(Gln) amidotransferase subunit B
MRSKEEAHDYRYFPEPDLVTVSVDDTWINKVKESLPELPDEKIKRFISQYSLPEYDAEVLTQNREISEYFEDVCRHVKPDSYKSASNWIMTEVMRILNDEKIEISNFWVSGKNLSSLINLIAEGKISNNIAKEVFAEMLAVKDKNDEKQNPEYIVREKNLLQVTDTGEIEKIGKKIINENRVEVERYKGGETKLLGFFVGKIMKESKGKANPKTVNELLISNLG